LIRNRPVRDIAAEYDIGRDALYRHRERHLPKAMTKAQALKEQGAADDLVERVEKIFTQAQDLMEKASKDGRYAPAVSALREARSCLELIGKLVGELKTGIEVNLWYSPSWVELRGTIFEVLQDYPQARFALAEKLAERSPDDDQDTIDI